MYVAFGQIARTPGGKFSPRRARSGFGQIEVDTAGMAHNAWLGVEPDLTAWLDSTAVPAISRSFAEGFKQGVAQAMPAIKKELAKPQESWAYLAIAGSWAVGVLVGVWLVARNTGSTRNAGRQT